ncbi:hypothetical protein BG842_26615 [Haladaptatus sp. W1]|nr:hypothetical protein BG842_26615 [Haladaptatus sp. W1]
MGEQFEDQSRPDGEVVVHPVERAPVRAGVRPVAPEIHRSVEALGTNVGVRLTRLLVRQHEPRRFVRRQRPRGADGRPVHLESDTAREKDEFRVVSRILPVRDTNPAVGGFHD